MATKTSHFLSPLFEKANLSTFYTLKVVPLSLLGSHHAHQLEQTHMSNFIIHGY